jgi:hypothetical protein
MTAPEYADVRTNAWRFAVLAAHVMLESEAVVATHRGWAIVETHTGLGADIAIRTVPRGARAAARPRS